MSDQYDSWRKRLAGEKLPTYVQSSDDVNSGFYRLRRKDKTTKEITWEPVAFWRGGDNELCGVRSGQILTADQCLDIWTFVVQYPITEETWRAVAERGEPWPGTDPTVAKQAKDATIDRMEAEFIKTTEAIKAGPEPTPDAKFAADIAEAKKGADAYKAIDSDELAAKAQDLRSHLTKLAGDADKLRAELKEPHLKAGREVDSKWQPIIKDAQAAAAGIRSAIEGWETLKRQQARLAEQARLAQEAEEARKRAEAIRAAEKANEPPPVFEEPKPVPVQSNAPAPAAQVKGATGRTASVSTYQHVVSIDEDKAFAMFKGNAELSALLMTLAQKAVNAGMPVPGAVTEERARVR